MRARWERWVLAGVVAIYLALGTVYSVVTPVFEAPDEPQHFFVVKHIVDHHSLPVQPAAGAAAGEGGGLWEQEASQPPLYYLVGAFAVSWIDLSDAETLLWTNPQANLGDPTNPGNKNVYVHTPEQSFPWHGAVLAVHILRFYSLALGATTIVLAWAVVQTVFPRRGLLACAVSGTIVAIPQFLFISSSVNNDNAMICLGTLTLYLLLRRLRDDTSLRPQLIRWIGLGIVLGLALLSKLSALTLLGLMALAGGVVAFRRRSWGDAVRVALGVCIPAALLAGWWYVRNLVLYGEPTGLSAMWTVVGRRDDFGQDLWGEFRALRYSFWGMFGWFCIPMSGWVYRALDALSLLSLAGLMVRVGRWVRQGRWRGAWLAWRSRETEWGAAYVSLCLCLMGVWLGATGISLTRWTSLTYGTQGRLLYVSIVPLALFLVLGWRGWFVPWRRARGAASILPVAMMLALAVAAPLLWLGPAYARPVPITDLPEGAIPLDLAFGDAIWLRGVGFEEDVVSPGEPFQVSLYWETSQAIPREDDVLVWLRLLDGRGEGIGLEDSYPGSGSMPASLWPVGQLLAGRQSVLVGADSDAPMIARMDVALYREDDGKRLVVPGGDVPTIGRVKVVPRRWPRVDEKQALARYRWSTVPGEEGPSSAAEGARLADGEWDEEVRPGERLTVTLTWVVQSAPERDYQVFVHLVDGKETIHAGGDGAPRGGDYPTWAWEAGEVVVDKHVLVVAADTPAGQYQIRAGLYDVRGRVAAYDGGGNRLPSDAVPLGVVEVR